MCWSQFTTTFFNNHGSCVSVESVTRNKCIIVTTRPNLPDARKWIDDNLQPLIHKSIPPGIDMPSSLLPRRLDKPIFTKTSTTYADILKKQFTLDPTVNATDTNNNRPPRKRHVSFLDYEAEQSTEYPPLVSNNAPLTSSTNVSATTMSAPTTKVDYAAELQLIKMELASLCTLITSAVEQMNNAVESFKATPPVPTREMEIDDGHSTEPTPETHELIAELKHDIATIALEMRLIVDLKLDIELIKSHNLFCHLKPINQHIPVT